MKAKFTRPDGTVVELEGTPEEIRVIIDTKPVPTVPVQPGFDPYKVTWDLGELLKEHRSSQCPACNGTTVVGHLPAGLHLQSKVGVQTVHLHVVFYRLNASRVAIRSPIQRITGTAIEFPRAL